MTRSTQRWGLTGARLGLRRIFIALFCLMTAVAAASPALARSAEHIESFASAIWVHRDGSMTVRETIVVQAAHINIKRGIYRDFPTVYKDRLGNRVKVDFEVESVLRDERPEPFHTERQSNGVRLYIGNKDVWISKGRHTYVITYRTDRQLGYFDGFDELYWNVTGNGWAFPIEHASATIDLPEGAHVLNHAGYTGRTGAKGKAFRYTPLRDGRVRFDTTKPLLPGEGLTVAVSWPPGYVERPSDAQETMYFVRDHAAAIAGLIGLGLLLAYYLYVWNRVGRDPQSGPIVPLYAPPTGLSPAGARYVMRMGCDDKVFTAAIVNMAVKGFLRIEEASDNEYRLERIDESAPLSGGERAVARKLFGSRRSAIDLEQKNHKTLQAAQKALQTSLRNEFEKVYFVRNRSQFFVGLGISLLPLLLLTAAADQPAAAIFITVWLAIWSVAVYFLFLKVLRGWRAALATGSIAGSAGALFMTLFALPFFGGEIMGLAFYSQAVSIGGAVVLLLVQVVNLSFYHLLKAPTLLGRKAMDQIEGFADYLSIAEKDRMNLLNPPQRTPELFEKFLPYALALGVEQAWSEQFADILERAASQGQTYSPHWYAGRRFGHGLRGFTSSLGSGFAGAVSAASTSPGSSSGSGGGGSSGGGGGGGGGGGW